MCALGDTMCGLGIKFCTIGPTLASVYSTSLDTMIYICTYTIYNGIFLHYLANSRTCGYFLYFKTGIYGYFYVAWGPICIFFGYCGHSSNFIWGACVYKLFFVIWWGPVSISFFTGQFYIQTSFMLWSCGRLIFYVISKYKSGLCWCRGLCL